MRFSNNEIILTRRERKALGTPSRHVSALAIGQLWRDAMSGIASRRENLGPAKSGVVAVPGIGGVTMHNAAFYEQRLLDRRQRCLESIGHMALAIELETIPTDQAL